MQFLYSQSPEGQRPRGRQRLRYKDTIKINLQKGILIPTRGNLWHYSEMYGETDSDDDDDDASPSYYFNVELSAKSNNGVMK